MHANITITFSFTSALQYISQITKQSYKTSYTCFKITHYVFDFGKDLRLLSKQYVRKILLCMNPIKFEDKILERLYALDIVE